jgi:hypothetical protein
MKKPNQFWAISGIAVALAFCGTNVMAQGGGGGYGGGGYGGGAGYGRGIALTSPQQLQQRADNMRNVLVVTNDDEWAVISPRLVTVMQLQTEQQLAGVADMLAAQAGNRGGNIRTAVAAMGVEADPSSTALTKALNDDAPIAELKLAMANFRQSRKNKQAALASAQAALQAVVSVRQEAILLSSGYLQ